MADRVLTEGLISSESANNLSDAAERLFVRILAAPTTDAWGRRDASSLRKLRADCIPVLDWDDTKLMQALEELCRETICELYVVEGRYYLRVCNWDLYQRNTARLRKGRSRIPPPQGDETTRERPANDRGATGGRSGLISGLPSVGLEDSEVYSDQSEAGLNLGFSEEEQPRDTTSLSWFLREVPGSSGRTAAAVSTLVKKYRLPEAALHAALEEMRAGGAAIHNKPGLVVSKLKEYGESGRYGR